MIRALRTAVDYLGQHSLRVSIWLLSLSLLDLVTASFMLGAGGSADDVRPFAATGLIVHLTITIVYATLVVTRVTAIVRGHLQARTRDLAFFLVVYFNAIVILALLCTALDTLGLSITHKSMFEMKPTGPPTLDFLYFAAVTFSGVGCGDIVPIQLPARMLMACGAVCGHLFAILGIGVVLNSVMQREN